MSTLSTPKPIPYRLARARYEAGLTQEELASKAECSVFSIGKYERGERTPGGPMLRRIGKATGREVGWFFTDEEEAA